MMLLTSCSKDRTSGTLRMIAGTATATGPDISSHFLYVLKDEQKQKEYDGKLHKVFSAQRYDMGTLPPSGVYTFIEDGGCRRRCRHPKSNKVTK